MLLGAQFKRLENVFEHNSWGSRFCYKYSDNTLQMISLIKIENQCKLTSDKVIRWWVAARRQRQSAASDVSQWEPAGWGQDAGPAAISGRPGPSNSAFGLLGWE